MSADRPSGMCVNVGASFRLLGCGLWLSGREASSALGENGKFNCPIRDKSHFLSFFQKMSLQITHEGRSSREKHEASDTHTHRSLRYLRPPFPPGFYPTRFTFPSSCPRSGFPRLILNRTPPFTESLSITAGLLWEDRPRTSLLPPCLCTCCGLCRVSSLSLSASIDFIHPLSTSLALALSPKLSQARPWGGELSLPWLEDLPFTSATHEVTHAWWELCRGGVWLCRIHHGSPSAFTLCRAWDAVMAQKCI